jgi:hypothetical protein
MGHLKIPFSKFLKFLKKKLPIMEEKDEPFATRQPSYENKGMSHLGCSVAMLPMLPVIATALVLLYFLAVPLHHLIVIKHEVTLTKVIKS